MDWALEHHPFSQFETFLDWFNAVDNDFKDNQRSSLLDIFDNTDITRARQEFESIPTEDIISERFISFWEMVEAWLK